MILSWAGWKVSTDEFSDYLIMISGFTFAQATLLPLMVGHWPTPVELLFNILFCDFIHFMLKKGAVK